MDASYSFSMKHFFYRILCAAAFFILIPIVFTLLIQGGKDASLEQLQLISSTEAPGEGFDEEILPGILANEITMETEPEAKKAQAVIARTNCARLIALGESLPEGLSKAEMVRLWGQESFSEYFSQLEQSIEETKGIVMAYDGECIQADFHRSSAGYTRDAKEVYGTEDYPYLKSVDSRMDLPCGDFLKVMFYTPKEFVEKGAEFFREETRAAASDQSAAELLSGISVTKRDGAGYVTEILMDGAARSGEEVRLSFGWNSSAFSLKEVDGKIRVTTKGLGHGLGLSLYGANCLAKEGHGWQEILEYFYAGIEFLSL